MSRRKSKPKEVMSPLSPDGMAGQIRASMGHPKYGYPKPKYPATRRLRCQKCNRTWKFSDKMNCGACPACKEGRLS